MVRVLNFRYHCEISTITRVDEKLVLRDGPVRLQALTREIHRGLKVAEDDLSDPIDPEIFKRLQHLDTLFIEWTRDIRAIITAGEVVTAGLAGLGAYKAMQHSDKLMKFFGKTGAPVAAAVAGVAVFCGLELVTSQFIGSEEAKELQKANVELRKFLDNERDNLKMAAVNMKEMVNKIRMSNGISDTDVNRDDVEWKSYHVNGKRHTLN